MRIGSLFERFSPAARMYGGTGIGLKASSRATLDQLTRRFDKTVYVGHVESLAPILEEVQTVTTGYIAHCNVTTMTCFAAGSNTAKDGIFGDNHYVGRGAESTDAAL